MNKEQESLQNHQKEQQDKLNQVEKQLKQCKNCCADKTQIIAALEDENAEKTEQIANLDDENAERIEQIANLEQSEHMLTDKLNCVTSRLEDKEMEVMEKDEKINELEYKLHNENEYRVDNITQIYNLTKTVEHLSKTLDANAKKEL